MDLKRSHVERGDSPHKPPRKAATPNDSSRKNLFSSPRSGEPVSKLFSF